MAADDAELARRKSLTFKEAEGLVPLPSQLNLRKTSPTLRARLYGVVHDRLLKDRDNYSANLREKSLAVMRHYCINKLGMMADELPRHRSKWLEYAKANYQADDYGKVFDFTQIFLRLMQEEDLSRQVSHILQDERAAYRLVDGDTIMPMSSEEEGAALNSALGALEAGELVGPRKHLVTAGARLTEGDYADSVRESLHAVESLARSKTGKSKFSDALRELHNQIPMHGSFRAALEKLYGYASDEPGVRHSNSEQGEAKVTERDALFVLGVCASFITYLLSA